jgi:hypothetical protein
LPAVVQELGAAAGLAGVVGLAVLAALYVAQARDVKRLRDWAGGAPERSGPGVTAVPRARPTATTRRPRRSPQRWRRRIGVRSVVVALVGLLVLVGAAARLTGHDGGDDSGKAQAKSGDGSSSKPRRSGATVKPGNVTVAVLNGTTVPGLAAALRDQIAAAGFRKGMINDFSDQQLAASIVQYVPGHQAEAQAVGRRFGIGRREPVTADSRALAGDATVIVIAGVDKAR